MLHHDALSSADSPFENLHTNVSPYKARLPLQSPRDLDATEAMHPLAVLFGFATKTADLFV